MNLKFWKRNKQEQRSADTNPDDMYYVSGGLISGLFGSGNPTQLSSVFAAVELISNSVAELPVYVKTNRRGSPEIVDHHNIYNVINNSSLTRFMLIKNLVSDMLLYGNGLAYIERNSKGEPVQIHYCQHGTYTIHKTTESIGTGKVIYHLHNLKGRKNIESCDVIHLFKNSVDGYTGKGVLDYAHEALLLASYAEKSASSFFQSGCKIGGILSTSSPKLSAKTKQDIRDAWQDSHGVANMNGIAVLEGGLQYQAIGVNSKDAQLLESRLYSLQEIARFFNINPALLGDLSKSSYSTVEAANLEFTSHTILPIITLIQEELNRKLLMPNETELYIDLDEGYLIKADKSATAGYLSTLTNAGIISINEARRQLGLNPIEGGDKNIVAYTDISQNTINDEQTNTTDKPQ